MKKNDEPTAETGEPSSDPTPGGDVPSLRELAEEEAGGTTDPDEVPAPED
jgi:hypothetical protein